MQNTRYAIRDTIYAILYTIYAIRNAIRENEPNFKNTKMNINHYSISNYEQNHLGGRIKNEPKRTQFRSHTAGIHLFMQNKANLQGG